VQKLRDGRESASNTKEQFAASPGLSRELVNATTECTIGFGKLWYAFRAEWQLATATI
jgi:hypothetical protein